MKKYSDIVHAVPSAGQFISIVGAVADIANTALYIHEGDTLETMEGTACITKIVKERHEEPVTVYNLAVKDWVSYFVGKVRVYVHNGAYQNNSTSKYLQELNNLSENKINHIINGSKNSNHR